MKSNPLRFHPQAEQEYLTALTWYRERSLIVAISFESALEQAVERVKEALLSGGQSTSNTSENTRFVNFLSAWCIRVSLLKP